MKKIITLFIILALSISLFSCAKTPAEDNAIPENLIEENNEQTEDQTEKTEDTPVIDTTNDEQITEQPPKNEDKATPCDVTIDEPFSDFEVVVSFTLEESAKDLEYFPEDFSEVDCFNVYPFDYYPEEIHPEYKGRKTVILMLNEQSKQGVLDAVKILEKDERVYSAEPNFIVEMSSKYTDYSTARLELTDEEFSKSVTYEYISKEYTEDDFNYDGVIKVYNLRDNKKMLDVRYKFNDYETLKQLANDKRVKRVYNHMELNSIDYDEIAIWFHNKEKCDYTVEDFSYIDIEEIIDYYDSLGSILIRLKTSGYKALFTARDKLLKDDIVRAVYFNRSGELAH